MIDSVRNWAEVKLLVSNLVDMSWWASRGARVVGLLRHVMVHEHWNE
jgi:hypothetical protein